MKRLILIIALGAWAYLLMLYGDKCASCLCAGGAAGVLIGGRL